MEADTNDTKTETNLSPSARDRARTFLRALDAGGIAHEDRALALEDMLLEVKAEERRAVAGHVRLEVDRIASNVEDALVCTHGRSEFETCREGGCARGGAESEGGALFRFNTETAAWAFMHRCRGAGLRASLPSEDEHPLVEVHLTAEGEEAVRAALADLDGDEIVKRCGCGRAYAKSEWKALVLVGTQDAEGESFELRTCACGTTLNVRAEVCS
ncbi:MAG: hypothetical protein KF850_34390 [Labilithrix sp.]|nr:hypothetical protein [Labilithrix sp.]MBX3217170.1 hypothetical protein [Labilithrix sp.]